MSGINKDELDELRKKGWSYPIKTKLDVFELIDTITLTESAVIDMQTEPDGTPYRFDRVFLKMSVNDTATEAGTWTYYDQNGKTAIIHYMQSGAAKNLGGQQVWKECGYWTGEVYGWRTVHTTYNSTQHAGRDAVLCNPCEGSYITSIKSQRLPVGVTVEIWAVRAKTTKEGV